MKIERKFLTSRVARRVYLLFVLCAFIPVTVFAVFSYVQVRGELRRTADEGLRQSTKMIGMSILERLLFLSGDLARYAVDLESPSTPNGDIPLVGQTQDRFERVFVLDTSEPSKKDAHGLDFGKLDSTQRQRLAQGTMLLTRPQTSGPAEVVLIQPIRSSSRVLVGVVRPEYLWSGDEFSPDSGGLLILDGRGRRLFSTPLGLAALESHRLGDDPTGVFRWSHGDRDYAGSYWTLFMEHDFAAEWVLVQSIESEAALAALESFSTVFVLIVVLSLLVVALLSSTQIRQQLVPIAKLIEATRQLRARDFSTRVSLGTKDEFGELGRSFNTMAEDLAHHIDIVKTSNVIGTLLSAEVDERSLLQTVLVGVRRVTNADGAAVYLLDDDLKLELALVDVDSLQLRSWDPDDLPTPTAPTKRRVGRSRDAAWGTDELRVTPEERAELERFEARFDYRVHSWLPMALRNHEKQLIGYLQVFNKRGTTAGGGFSPDDEEVVESLASQAAVAITKNRLVHVFQNMFESLTNLIAVAVDAKSPYTGRHCQRVPVLAMMLADAACKTKAGPLQDFELSSEELYELKIAALLHDCGKVTTPVHVIDKATKLETIHDRIDLIATRFQALKSQRGLMVPDRADRQNAVQNSDQERQKAQIDADLEFLTRCNKGGEWMPQEDQERVRRIAREYSWTTPTGDVAPILTEDEVQNLCITKGTLNQAEREIINDHVVATMNMLATLPYPRNLRAVPELAGAHHEKLDGSGYPRGLTSPRLSMRARILAFADIFEALTAKDRPYKDGKKLSEAMRILEAMTNEGQLDRDLLDVLVREGVYLEYAEKYLDPEQIDERRFDHLVNRDRLPPKKPEVVPATPRTT